METYTREGLTFDVTDIGPTEGPVVVLLHGFPEDRHCWDQIASALADAGYRVLAPDQRGYSPRARPNGRRAYTMEKLTDDVIALGNVAGANRFHVVGHDWGGVVAWDLAARYPERVITLSSLSTPHPKALQSVLLHSPQLAKSWYVFFFQLPYLPEAVLRRSGEERAVRALVAGGLDTDVATRYAERLADPKSARAALNWYRALPFGRLRARTESRLRARTTYRHTPTPNVTVPTLYVWSEGDVYLTRAAAEATAKYVSGPYCFEVISGMSHWLPTSAAKEVTPLILAHLARED